MADPIQSNEDRTKNHSKSSSFADSLCSPYGVGHFNEISLREFYVLLSGHVRVTEKQTLEFDGEGGIGDMDVTILVSRNGYLRLTMHPLIHQHPFLNDDPRVFAVDSKGEHNLHLTPAIPQPKTNVGLQFGLILRNGDFQYDRGPVTIMSTRCSNRAPGIVSLLASLIALHSS